MLSSFFMVAYYLVIVTGGFCWSRITCYHWYEIQTRLSWSKTWSLSCWALAFPISMFSNSSITSISSVSYCRSICCIISTLVSSSCKCLTFASFLAFLRLQSSNGCFHSCARKLWVKSKKLYQAYSTCLLIWTSTGWANMWLWFVS